MDRLRLYCEEIVKLIKIKSKLKFLSALFVVFFFTFIFGSFFPNPYVKHQLKIEGKFKEYERSKILENAKAWLKQAEVEKEILKSALKAQYILEDGRVEEWEGGISPEELEAKIDAEFEKFKTEFIAKLENGND